MLFCDGRLFCNNFSDEEVFPVNDVKLSELAQIVAEGRKMQDRMSVLGIIADQVTAMKTSCIRDDYDHVGLGFRLEVFRSRVVIATNDVTCHSNNMTLTVSESDAAELADVIHHWLGVKLSEIRREYERLGDT